LPVQHLYDSLRSDDVLFEVLFSTCTLWNSTVCCVPMSGHAIQIPIILVNCCKRWQIQLTNQTTPIICVISVTAIQRSFTSDIGENGGWFVDELYFVNKSNLPCLWKKSHTDAIVSSGLSALSERIEFSPLILVGVISDA